MAIEVRNRYVYLRRRIFARWLFRPRIWGLKPERLYLWSHALIETADVPGAVAEIGCSLGATAAYSSQLLHNIGVNKRYVAVDTFTGFVPAQFDYDAERGTPESMRHVFSSSSIPLVQLILRQLGAHQVELIRGDIVKIPPKKLPQQISAALIDVDLSIPVHAALQKVWPMMSPGGVVLVDDCDPQNPYRAWDGYQRFCDEQNLHEHYEYGMGVLRRASKPAVASGTTAVGAVSDTTASSRH